MEEVKDEHDPPRKGLAHSEHHCSRVSWDERIIAEHDELRGTRQKINEPDTPYHYCTGDDVEMSYSSANSQTESIFSPDVKADWDETDMVYSVSSNSSFDCNTSSSVYKRKGSEDLIQVGIRGKEQSKRLMQEIRMRLPTSKALDEERTARWGGEEVGNSGTNSHAKVDFKKKRTAHYNEFQKMKEWRANQGVEWTDGDEGDYRDSDSAISDL